MFKKWRLMKKLIYLSDSSSEESEEKNLNDTSVSALDMILKSLRKVSLFLSDFLLDFVRQEHDQSDESVLPQDMLRSFLLKELSLTQPLEANGVSNLYLNILDLLPRWNSHFQVNEVVEKICNRCKTDMAISYGCYYGVIASANSLREFKSAFKDFTFETILKVSRIYETIPCNKKGCGKKNYVDRMIYNLPSAFTIALKWENNETEEEIFDTASLLATEIDISAIYLYEGQFTKYRLVSMVWSHGDVYNCIAYEKNRWVRHFGSEIEVIGEWNDVLSISQKLHIRPEILFFENAMQRDQIFQSKDLKTNKSFYECMYEMCFES